MSIEWFDGEFDRSKIEISDERLAYLMTKLTPLYQREGEDEVWTIEIPDLRKTAFTWEPKPIKRIEFTPAYAFFTSHSCGYYGLFKPSIAEVLAHVEDDEIETYGFNAFYIDMASIEVYRDGMGHRAITHFVKAEL